MYVTKEKSVTLNVIKFLYTSSKAVRNILTNLNPNLARIRHDLQLCFERLIYAHVEPIIDQLLPQELTSFQHGRSTVDRG